MLKNNSIIIHISVILQSTDNGWCFWLRNFLSPMNTCYKTGIIPQVMQFYFLALKNYSLNVILYHKNLLKALFNSFKLLLEYSCFKMLCQFLLYSKVSQLYVCKYPLFGFPSHLGHHRAWSGVSCAVHPSASYTF